MAGVLGHTLAALGFGVQFNVAIAGKLRPAYLYLTGWSWPKADAIYLTIINHMADFEDPQAHHKVEEAEKDKHVKYDDVCAAARVYFHAMGFSILGGAGSEAQAFLACLRERMVQLHGEVEGPSKGSPGEDQRDCATRAGRQASQVLVRTFPSNAPAFD